MPGGSLVSQYLKQKKDLRRLRREIGDVKETAERSGKAKRTKSRKGYAQEGMHHTDAPHEHLEVYRQWKAKQDQ